MSQAAAKLQR